MIGRYNFVNKSTLGAGLSRITNQDNALALSTVANAVDKLWACPIFLPAGRIDRLGFEITGAGGASNKARLGLFAADGKSGRLYPGKWMGVETAEADGTVTGIKETTGLAVDIDEGLYFLVYVNGAGTLCTVRALALGGVPALLGATSTPAAITQISVAKTYSATGFAAMCQSTTDLTFPTGGAYEVTAPPIVWTAYSR